MLEKRSSLILLLLTIAFLIPLCRADFTPGDLNIYVWVDETQYEAGETITLYFTIFNAKSSEIVINEVEVISPWFMYIKDHWEGNQTIKINKVINAGQVYYNFTTLTVPSDGRAFSANSFAPITVTTKIDNALNSHIVYIGIAGSPVQSSVKRN